MTSLLGEWAAAPIIPVDFSLGANLWAQHGEELLALIRRYPGLFPSAPDALPVINEGEAGLHEKTQVADNWGTVREFIFGGLDGVSKSYPLADWDALDTFVAPDPLIYAERALRDWDALHRECAANRRQGQLTLYYIGEFHERMYYLRGYENYLLDLAEEPPQLPRLFEIVLSHNLRLIDQCLACGVNLFVFHDDLGTQKQLMMRPASFRKWLKPGYRRMWTPIKTAGQYVYLHSDGMIREILPDLIEVGLDVVNPQVAVNGIDEIARICRGRIAVKANLDDQVIIPHGSAAEIREHVREVVMKLGSAQGGLSLEAKLIGPVPLGNLEALFSSAEEMRVYYR
jgi:uroporphyrinogen decarboxylase